jgi:hypothetical protein
MAQKFVFPLSSLISYLVRVCFPGVHCIDTLVGHFLPAGESVWTRLGPAAVGVCHSRGGFNPQNPGKHVKRPELHPGYPLHSLLLFSSSSSSYSSVVVLFFFSVLLLFLLSCCSLLPPLLIPLLLFSSYSSVVVLFFFSVLLLFLLSCCSLLLIPLYSLLTPLLNALHSSSDFSFPL